MKLHFLGANRQVTGSRYALEVGSVKVLIDCGMFQERPFLERNWLASPIPPGEIEALLLTHVHIDHCGLLPRLVAAGFQGPIHTTRASVALAEVMLRDAAKIQMEDAAYKRKRHSREQRQGRFPVVPLYDDEAVSRTLPLFRGTGYGHEVAVAPGITATFFDAGHILGSAMIEVKVEREGATTRVLFSGDIGQWHKPIIRDPTLFERADYVVMESTYGDRDHEEHGDIEQQLADVIVRTVRRNGKVLIPTFAVERAQELVYYIGRLVRSERIPDVRVFLDSPMAVDVTEIYRRCGEYFDQEMWAMINSRQTPLHFPGLRMCTTVAESRAINSIQGPAIIMAPSGMCTAGRIKHHLRQHIGRPENTVLFVGYQARDTLGRQILEGNPVVRIHGQNQRVEAEVAQIFGFSGHADRAGLLRWIGHLQSAPRQIFLTHGEESAALALAQQIMSRWGWPVGVPHYGDVVELSSGVP